MMLKMGLMMMMMISDDDYDDDGCMFCSNLHKRPGGVRGVRGYSGFQVTGMIEWGQKSKPNKILKASYNPPPKIPGLKHNPPKNPMPNFRALDGTTTPNIVALIMLRVLPPCCSGMQTVQQLPTSRNNMQQGKQSGAGADYSAPHGPGADATCNFLKNVGGCFYLLASNVASVCTLHGAFELTSNKLSAKE